MDKKLAERLWLLSYPTMISMAMESIFEIIDMIWIGRISKVAVSGVTLFVTMLGIFLVFNEIIGAASVSMISQAYGRKKYEKVNRIAEQTISFKVIMAVISCVIFSLSFKSLIGFYTDDAEVMRSAFEYGFIRIFFLPMNFASYSVNTIFRCTNDAKMPMRLMLISAILNTILDPVFMFDIIPFTNLPGLGMGVFGAAVATVVSTVVSFVVGIGILLKGHNGIKITWKGLFSLEPDIDRELLRIGVPPGIETTLRSVSQAILIKFVSFYGITAITVAGICGKIFNFALMPLGGFSMGGSAIVGHLLGEENIEGAKKATTITTVMCVIIMSGFMVLTLFFSRDLIRLFIDDAEVIDMGSVMLNLASISFVIEGMTFGKRIVFAGSGDTFPLLSSGFLSKWIGQLGVCYVVVNMLHLDINYVWASYITSALVNLLVTEYYYRKGNWELMRV